MLYFELITSHLTQNSSVLGDGRQSFTYKDVDAICGRLETALRKLGVLPKDRIFLLAENTVNTVLIILACMRMGVCFVPLPHNIGLSSLTDAVRDAAPTLLIGEYGLDNVKCITAANMMKLSENEGYTEAEELTDLTSYIIYTSGSTGKAKGVVATEDNVLFCVKGINKRLCNTASDKILCCLPLSFDYGLYQIFLALDSCAFLLLPPDNAFHNIPSILIRHHITGFPAIPSMLNMLLKTRFLDRGRFDDLRYITSTGESFPVEMIKKIMSVLPGTMIIPMYGLTECKRVSVMPLDRTDKVLNGSCGLPLDGVEVWLENKDDKGVGELIVRGKNVMNGYWNDAETTRKYFFGDNGDCLRTGDLFRIDEEGFLYFVERNRDILKVSGYRIGISELENSLLSVMGDACDELAVIGCPDEMTGERCVVCICSSRSRDHIVELLSTVPLSPYQRPSYLYLSDVRFPRNGNGKLDRSRLKEFVTKNECIRLR